MPTTSNATSTLASGNCVADPNLGDIRRRRTFDWLSELMVDQQSCVINRLCDDESKRKRAERFINNEKLSASQVIEACCLPIGSVGVAGQTLLNVMDQSVLHLYSALGRMSGQIDELGMVSNGKHGGQNLVASLLVRPTDYGVIGLSSLLFHSVDPAALKSGERLGVDTRPFAYRQSDKWVRAAHQTNARAIHADQIIHVIDREADNLQVIGRILNDHSPILNDIVIRARFKDRRVVASQNDAHLGKGKVQDLLSQKSPVLCYQVNVPSDERMKLKHLDGKVQRERYLERACKRQGRTAFLQVRHLCCQMDEQALSRSRNGSLCGLQMRQLLAQTKVCERTFNYIEVSEVDTQGHPICSSSKDYQPINWLLLTSCTVNDSQDLMHIIDIYRHRFGIIEQFFRCLKNDGFRVQQAQQQSLKSLQIVIAMAAKASALILKMISARDQDEGFDIEEDFTDQQIEVLQLCLKRYQGRTSIQRNHHPPNQLSWAAWIIARMGGWKPQNKQRPPGPKTFQRGMEVFAILYQGVALAKGWDINVSQP